MGNSSVDVKTQKPTRDLLAPFAGNQRVVKLLENLALDVSTTIPGAMDQLQQDSDSVRFLSVLVQAIADSALALAQQATEGPPAAAPGEPADDVPPAAPQIYEGIAIGGIYLTVDPANPSTTLGYGVWAAWGAGQFPVSYLALDADFGTVEATGGAKTASIADHVDHKHNVTTNVAITTAVINQGGGAPVTVVTGGANSTVLSDVETPVLKHVDGGTGLPGIKTLPPFIVAFFWKRTA